jgi:hypothetical protein
MLTRWHGHGTRKQRFAPFQHGASGWHPGAALASLDDLMSKAESGSPLRRPVARVVRRRQADGHAPGGAEGGRVSRLKCGSQPHQLDASVVLPALRRVVAVDWPLSSPRT